MDVYIIIQKCALRYDGYFIGAEDRFLSTMEKAEILILTNEYCNLGYIIKYYTDPKIISTLSDIFSENSYITPYSTSEEPLYKKIIQVYKDKIIPKIYEYYKNYSNKLISFNFKKIVDYSKYGLFENSTINDLNSLISVVNTFTDLENVIPIDLINIITNYIFEWENKAHILMTLGKDEIILSTKYVKYDTKYIKYNTKYEGYKVHEFLEICGTQNIPKFMKFVEYNHLQDNKGYRIYDFYVYKT